MRTALQELIYHELLKAREAVDLAARLKSSGNDSSIRDTYTSLWLASIQKVAEASGLPPRVIRGKQDENEES